MSPRSKRYLVLVCVALELCVIAALSVHLYAKEMEKRDLFAHASVLPQAMYHAVLRSPIFPHFYEPEPNKTIIDNFSWLNHAVTYTINADGLNERMEYSVKKPENTYRIMTLGDSFTYGLTVDTPNNYSEKLEDMLGGDVCQAVQRYDVINLGVPGYDLGYAAERYRLRGQKYMPDMIIWFMNSFTMKIDADRRVELESQYLEKTPEDQQWQMIDGRIQFYPGMLAWNQFLRETHEQDRVDLQMRYLGDFLNSYEGPLIVVANNWDEWEVYAKYALQRALFGRMSTWTYVIRPALQKDVDLNVDMHPNERGHERIASQLHTFVTDQHVLPCGQGAP